LQSHYVGLESERAISVHSRDRKRNLNQSNN